MKINNVQPLKISKITDLIESRILEFIRKEAKGDFECRR